MKLYKINDIYFVLIIKSIAFIFTFNGKGVGVTDSIIPFTYVGVIKKGESQIHWFKGNSSYDLKPKDIPWNQQ